MTRTVRTVTTSEEVTETTTTREETTEDETTVLGTDEVKESTYPSETVLGV